MGELGEAGGAAWYEEAFRGEYLSVYSHRDDESARSEAEFAIAALDLAPGNRVLDLAGGAGRHARALAARGLAVLLLDLSPELLAVAAERGGGLAGIVRGDMRHVPFAGPFDAVTMFFTSFGYFREEAENEGVLEEAARVLCPGGGLLLDGLNRDRTIAGLVPQSEREGPDGSRIMERRHITPDGLRVEKDVAIFRGDRPVREYTESVRLYDPAELADGLERAGFAVAGRYGDLAGSPFAADSPRLVLTGRKRC